MPAGISLCLRLAATALSLIALLAAFLAPASAAGSAGTGLNFDGSTDDARGGPISTTGPQTIEAWIKPSRIGFSIYIINSDDVTGWLVEMDEQGYPKFWAANTSGTWNSAPNWNVKI